MESKFKVGDRVRLKTNGNIVRVDLIKDGWIAYIEDRRITGTCRMEEAEPIDSKTAFLSELKGLLAKYDAVINVSWNDYFDTAEAPRIDMAVQFKGSNRGISFDDVLGCSITADSIMDYDKE